MRQDLTEYIAAGGEGVSPAIVEGVRLLGSGPDPKGYYGPPKA
jgi:hypothetical protein